MYSSSELKGMLFIDIETCTQYKDLSDLEKNGPDGLSELWAKKADSIRLYEEDKRELSKGQVFTVFGEERMGEGQTIVCFKKKQLNFGIYKNEFVFLLTLPNFELFYHFMDT
jgi:hypothetical protein